MFLSHTSGGMTLGGAMNEVENMGGTAATDRRLRVHYHLHSNLISYKFKKGPLLGAFFYSKKEIPAKPEIFNNLNFFIFFFDIPPKAIIFFFE